MSCVGGFCGVIRGKTGISTLGSPALHDPRSPVNAAVVELQSMEPQSKGALDRPENVEGDRLGVVIGGLRGVSNVRQQTPIKRANPDGFVLRSKVQLQPPSQVWVEQVSVCPRIHQHRHPLPHRRRSEGNGTRCGLHRSAGRPQTKQLSLDQGQESLKKRVTMRSGVPTTVGHSRTEGNGVIGYRLPALLHGRSFASQPTSEETGWPGL